MSGSDGFGVVFDVTGEFERLESGRAGRRTDGIPDSSAQYERPMYCDRCECITRHFSMANASWVCGCGFDQTEQLRIDNQRTLMIQAVAEMFAGMRPNDRFHWLKLLVECLCCIPGVKRAIVDVVGQREF